MQAKNYLTLTLLILLIISMVFNFSQYYEKDKLRTRIENFLPVAAQADKEMEYLRYNKDELISKVTELEIFKDSILKTRSIAPNLEPKAILFPGQRAETQQPGISTQPTYTPKPNNFEDLNKKGY